MKEFPDAAALVHTWAEGGSEGGEPQRPDEELWAEHFLIRSVVEAMREEAMVLREGSPLRPAFWEGVVDFIGNFVHRVHRAKEEDVFFPVLVEQGLIDSEREAHLHDEHSHLKDLTLELCDGVSEGDWEKAMRVVARYLDLMTAHLDAEERHMRNPAVRALPAEEWKDVQRSFGAIEGRVLGESGRREYLELTRSLCADVEITTRFEGD